MNSGWNAVVPTLEPEQRARIVEEVSQTFRGMPLSELRGDREKLVNRTIPMIRAILGRYAIHASPEAISEMAREVVAHVGGLGFLEPLLRLDSGYSEIAVTPEGRVWVVPRGEQDFISLAVQPSLNDVWRAVETLLAPLGRGVSEATPSVDTRIPRQEGLPGGARVKIIHPVIAPGDGYPSLNIRLYEPKPVPPEQLVAWEVAPEWLIHALVEAVGKGARLLVIGGTATGKTTVLSALCSGIPKTARVVKI